VQRDITIREPSVTGDKHVEVALKAERAGAELLFSVEEVAPDKSLDDSRAFGGEEVRIHIHANEQRLS